MPQQQKHIDLTDKKALVAAFKKHPEDLWASFGTAPTYKDYDVNKVIDYIESVIKRDNVHISDKKKEEIFSTLHKFGKGGKKALQYIGNVFLRGAGLGLNDNKEELLRQVIREEIRKIIKEEKNFNKMQTLYKKLDDDMHEIASNMTERDWDNYQNAFEDIKNGITYEELPEIRKACKILIPKIHSNKYQKILQSIYDLAK